MNFLILPGWCLASHTYGDLKKLLERKGHSVQVVDFPGFTQKLTKPMNLDDYVAYIRDYMSENRISRPVIIGHSFGGRVALRLLHNYPSAASSLILTGAPAYRADSPTKISLFKLVALVGKPVAKYLLSGGLLELFTKGVYKLAGNFDYYRADPMLKKTFQNVINDSLEKDVKNVSANTYLLWGTEDTITPLWIAKKIEKNMQHARLLLAEHAGHNFPYKQPDKFVDLLDTILRQEQ